MATALVLSGGGAKGSFEVGALQYLYERDFVANIICSTSVGSINGLQLAHGGTASTQRAAFDKLKTIWTTELTFNQDMYTEAPWLAQVSPKTRTAIANLFDGTADVMGLMSTVVFFPPLAIVQAAALGGDLIDALDGLKRASSVFTLDPIRQKIARNLSPQGVAQSGVQLRLVAVSLDSGAVRYITESGRVIETDGRPVAGPNPTVCTTERARYNAAVDARNAAAVAVANNPKDPELKNEYKQATAAANDAKSRLEACLAQNAGAAQQLTVPVSDGAIASSSIPCVFPPVKIGDEAYVDGGVRWVLPLQAAVDLDPDLTIAINASPAGVPAARRRYVGATILDIAERTVLDVLLWEIQERHLSAARLASLQRKQKTWVITPRIDVHDTLTIDPGLIDINMGYGYMCAADVTTAYPFMSMVTIDSPGTPVLTPGGHVPHVPIHVPQTIGRLEGSFIENPADPKLAALADAIARCRRRCWELEHAVFGAQIGETPFAPRRELSLPPQPDALDEVRRLKTVLGLLVAARDMSQGRVPSDASAWADRWERHRWQPTDVPGVGNTPWSAFVSRAGERAAATRQNAIVVSVAGQPEVYVINPLRHLIPSAASLNAFGGPGVVATIEPEYLNAFPQGAPVV